MYSAIRPLETLLHWCIDHWKSVAIVTSVSSFAAIDSWIRARRKERAEAHQAKVENALDTCVYEALLDPKGWPVTHGFTFNGYVLVNSEEIAERLSLERKLTDASLQRLAVQRKIRNAGGSQVNPNWHVL